MKPEAWLDLHSADDVRYALAKQLDGVLALETTYGRFELDPQMRAAVQKALRPLLERRLAVLEKAAARRAAGEFSHEKTQPPQL
jgi:hypothetical protein